MAGDLTTVIQKVRAVIDNVRAGDWASAFLNASDLVAELRLAFSAGPITLPKFTHSATAVGDPSGALEAWCEEAEKLSKLHGDASAIPWASLIPLVLQLVQWLLSMKSA